MRKRNLTTFTEASEELGVSRVTIADLCAAHGIQPERLALNGSAKGLTKEHMETLRECLGLSPQGKVTRPCPQS